jgi:hypothetical protein
MVESRKPADSLLLIDPADPAKPVFPALSLQLHISLVSRAKRHSKRGKMPRLQA